ncbi:nicotinate (nicotinamide) nucleotide adenylyltransferase [Ferruginibacter albus]|uniref:nicotinate (nicotinamide) nucleotide adenylyltransferase n=1 Tax=Ferruginibacter albus TaxID=2875540 RepID=UPI001CC4E700|nr:nicotinate (nicotinamide) nucleotide adenylyltransferase [Ferruginibacter albus]UAY52071.1 nicotinate-nucleotide adenylyltransferase [Ferruginibacter albus]
MKIGLYFGSFNPIHIGHLIIASHITNFTSLDQVWFVVSPQNPLKPSSSLLNEYHRLHFVQLAIEGESKLKASDVEFHLPKPSYTVDTLAYLKEKYPQHEFAVIMGADSFSNISNWKNYEVLLKNNSIYIYKRKGFEITDALGADIILLEAPILDISSTHIRNLIKTGKSTRYLLPDVVNNEIEKNNYYK